ncbi:HD domain-containing protein [Candidatus Desantisbacteria bacterium]|nr:HD domain-containing protein [Candidatus Desantisbacteria bacterium]
MNLSANCKIFNDAVHGFIYLSNEYCEKIIDTPHFQRLKRLEQTNVRPLYPCAHHDRFVHSLGTYHLGSIVSEAVYENSHKHFPDLDWTICRRSFEIACLLHDIGHAPFSHTFEMYYEEGDNLNKLLTDGSFINSPGHNPERNEFFSDYNNTTPNQKQHEKVSAILVLTTYYPILTDLSADPFLVARMILGLCYIDYKRNNHKKLYNCFIGLLNGKTIDVDKLDYIARDQWATGHILKSISIERLLSSVYIKKINDNYVSCFHKRAVNEIFTLIEARKSMDVRFYGHLISKSSQDKVSI